MTRIEEGPRGSRTQTPGKRWIGRLAKTALWLLIACFLYRYLKRNWTLLDFRQIAIPAGALSLAFVLLAVGNLLHGILWAPLLRQVSGVKMPLLSSWRISALCWMGRYIPGKIWAMAGKVYLSSPDKNQSAGITLAVFLEAVLQNLAGVLLAALMLAFCGDIAPHLAWALDWAPILALGVLIGLHPRIFVPVSNLILGLLRQPKIEHGLRYSRMMLVVGGYTLANLFWAGGFAAVAMSIGGLPPGVLPYLLAIYPLAWAAGFIVLMAPAGLGVRDSLLMAGLSPLLPSHPAEVLMIVAASRLLTTVCEVLNLLFASLAHALARAIAPPAPSAD